LHHNDAPPDDATGRADRVLVAVLAIVLATASAAIGAAMTHHPGISLTRLIEPARQTIAPATQIAPDDTVSALIAEHRCLTEALYYEARGEGRRGQQAVAEVVFHRLSTGRYGRSICAVIYEGAMHPGCQFSFTCDGSMRHLRDESAWKDAEQLAEQILTGAIRLGDATGGAINYHAITVSPAWAPALDETAQIGNHIFYRGAPSYRLALPQSAKPNADDPGPE
jgi:spore germination cell wall hydrolase CwlJ-like protein